MSSHNSHLSRPNLAFSISSIAIPRARKLNLIKRMAIQIVLPYPTKSQNLLQIRSCEMIRVTRGKSRLRIKGKFLRCENPSNDAVHSSRIDVNGANLENGLEKVGNLGKNDVCNLSQDTRTEKILPVVIDVDDDDENQLDVSSETSKYILFKRFKFSPGMSPEVRENGMDVSPFYRLSEAHSQYRMCASIMGLSNALIYGNRLRCGSSEIENAKIKYGCSSTAGPACLMEVLNPNQPVIFINSDLLPAYETNDRKAVNNVIEAYIIPEVTKALLEELKSKILASLLHITISQPVEIHTIDKYQGREIAFWCHL